MANQLTSPVLILGCFCILVFQLILFGSNDNSNGIVSDVYGQTCYPVPKDLVGWWSGDESASDIFGKNHGRLMGDIEFVEAMVKSGFFFNGSNYVSINDSKTLDFGDSFTIDAWIKPGIGGVTILDKTENNDLANYRLFLGVAGNSTDSRIGFWNGDRYVLSTQSIPLNQFSHVAITLKHVGGIDSFNTLKIYINGILDSAHFIGFGKINDGQVRIGSDINGRYFQGVIDEVEIFNRDLSQSEIGEIANAGPNGKCKPLPQLDTSIISAKIKSISLKNNQSISPLGPITFDFTGTSSHGVKGYQCSINGQAFVMCKSPVTYSLLDLGFCHSDGTCRELTSKFSVRTVDKLEKTDSTPATFQWTFLDVPVNGHAASCDQLFEEDSPLFWIDYRTLFTGVANGVPAWVNVNNDTKFMDATGRVELSEVTHQDSPPTHDSHDENIDIYLDPGQKYLLSNTPLSDNKLGTEWEIGTYTNEKLNQSPERYFPHWAWPSVGDRVWVNGNWVFDCGEPKGEGYWTELHPIRAVASMRDSSS